MNLIVNSVNFNGKKEVLYGLTKAAKYAKDYEYTKCYSRMGGMTKYEERISCDSYMHAYLDMATRDSAFLTTIKNANEKELSSVKHFLSPEQTQHALVKPFDKFSEEFYIAINNNFTEKMRGSIKNTIIDFIIKLKS